MSRPTRGHHFNNIRPKSLKLFMKPDLLAFSHIGHCRKKGKGQIKVIFWTILVELKRTWYCIQSFKTNGPLFWKRRFFLPYIFHLEPTQRQFARKVLAINFPQFPWILMFCYFPNQKHQEIVPCRKTSQVRLKFIIWIILIVLEQMMLHTKFQGHLGVIFRLTAGSGSKFAFRTIRLRCPSYIFFQQFQTSSPSETIWPIVFNLRPPGLEGTKSCSNSHSYITNMAVTQTTFFSRSNVLIALELYM